MSKQKTLSEYPALIGQWDFEKNSLDPAELTAGSGKKVWWLCDKGHSWKAVISDRTKGSGCPVCSNKQVLAGFNDLQTLKPELAKEWDYERNDTLPTQFTTGSEKKVWWLSKEGHSWEALIHNRNAGHNCPYCAGVWVFEGYNDLQTLKPNLAQEWDDCKNEIMPMQVTAMSNKMVWWKCEIGHSWKASVCHRVRGSGCPYCSGQRVLAGFNDLQTLNPELAGQWDLEMNTISPSCVMSGSGKTVWWRCANSHSWKATIVSRNKGCGCPYCAGQRVTSGENDLQTLNPRLAQEWDFEKNILLPSQVTSQTGQKAWWQCDKGHSWHAQIGSRHNGSGCPYCTGRLLLSGFNDLQTIRPDLANEWDNERNVLEPSQVAAGSEKSVWWNCDKGHAWKTSVSCRSKNGKRSGSGCPYCSGKKVLPGFNDLKTLNPQLSREWDYEKNTLNPSQVTVASGKSVWWKCERNGHSWKAQIASRSVSGRGCPYCFGVFPYIPRCVK